MRKMFSINQIKEIVNEGIEDGSIHADPSTEVKVADINSESATAGKVIIADGDGKASWGEVETDIQSVSLSDSNTYSDLVPYNNKIVNLTLSINSNTYSGIAFISISITHQSFGDTASGEITFYYSDKKLIFNAMANNNIGTSMTIKRPADSIMEASSYGSSLFNMYIASYTTGQSPSLSLDNFKCVFYIDTTTRSNGDVIPEALRKYYETCLAIMVNNKVYHRMGYESRLGSDTGYQVFINVTIADDGTPTYSKLCYTPYGYTIKLI